MTVTSASTGTFRAGVWAADCDRGEYVFFSFVPSPNGDWTANSTTTFVWPEDGVGRTLAAFECCGFEGLDATRHVELVADGQTVGVFMDGLDGGKAPFRFDNISFGFGAYAQGDLDDFVIHSVDARFDNARIVGQTDRIGDAPCVGVPTGPQFVRGDPDDSGSSNITDAISTLNFLFGGTAEPACLEAADIDNDGSVNISDPIRLLNFLFGGGAAPPEAPIDACGSDPSEPTLNCVFTNC
jgi:hypothetical protein